MNTTLKTFLIIIELVYLLAVTGLLKRKKLALRYSLLWITSGIVMLFLTVFPGILERVVHLVGIIELTNGLFAILAFFMLVIMVSITTIVSKMNDQIRQLTQKCAVYEKRIRILEETHE